MPGSAWPPSSSSPTVTVVHRPGPSMGCRSASRDIIDTVQLPPPGAPRVTIARRSRRHGCGHRHPAFAPRGPGHGQDGVDRVRLFSAKQDVQPHDPSVNSRRLFQRVGCRRRHRHGTGGAGYPDGRQHHPSGQLLWRVGFKPTHGTLSVAGVKALAPSLDTLGWFTRHLEDTCTLFSELTSSGMTAPLESRMAYAVIPCRVPPVCSRRHRGECRLDDAAARMASLGAQLSHVDLGNAFDALVTYQQTILAYEAARALASEHERFAASMSQALLGLLDEGQAIPLTCYWQARQATEEARRTLSLHLAERLMCSSLPEAPRVWPRRATTAPVIRSIREPDTASSLRNLATLQDTRKATCRRPNHC